MMFSCQWTKCVTNSTSKERFYILINYKPWILQAFKWSETRRPFTAIYFLIDKTRFQFNEEKDIKGITEGIQVGKHKFTLTRLQYSLETKSTWKSNRWSSFIDPEMVPGSKHYFEKWTSSIYSFKVKKLYTLTLINQNYWDWYSEGWTVSLLQNWAVKWSAYQILGTSFVTGK